MAYARLEPFGEERADYRNAMLMTMIANMFAKEGEEKTIDDFLPRFGVDEDELESERAQKATDKAKHIFGMLAARNNPKG
jgi:hypothetical protein